MSDRCRWSGHALFERRMWQYAIVACCLTAGCLPDPEPPRWTGRLFPPSDMTVFLREGQVLDINGDGIDDAVLPNDPCANGDEVCDTSSQGFFVLLGEPGNKLANYYTFTPTPRARPYSIEFSDVNGDGLLDALVFGLSRDDENYGFTAVHLARSHGSFDEEGFGSPLPWPFPPSDDGEYPNLIVRADVDNDADPDFIVCQWGYNVWLEIQAGASLRYSAPFTPDDMHVDRLLPLPGARAGYQDLLLDHDRGLTVYRNTTLGTFELENSNIGDPKDIFAPNRLALFVDMFGDDLPDSIGAAPDVIRVTKTNGDGESLLFDTESTPGIPLLFAPVDFGGDPAPDVIQFRRNGACGGSDCTYTLDTLVDLAVVGDVFADATGGFGPRWVAGDGETPAVAIAGDFDDDDIYEVLLYEVDGTRTCLIVTLNEISPC